MAFFSGTNGLIAKIVLLCGFNAIVVWAATVLATHHKWIPLLVVALAAAAIDAIYLIPNEKLLPAKFLIPGTIFLVAFTVIPIVYTINIAFTNYSTGHILTKSEAIQQIQLVTRDAVPNSPTYTIAPARDADGNLVLLMVNDTTGEPFRGNARGTEASAGREGLSGGRSPRRRATSSSPPSPSTSTATSSRSPEERRSIPKASPARSKLPACATTRGTTRSRASPTAPSTTTTARVRSSLRTASS